MMTDSELDLRTSKLIASEAAAGATSDDNYFNYERKQNEIILTAMPSHGSDYHPSRLSKSIILTASAATLPLPLSGFNLKSTARSCCPIALKSSANKFHSQLTKTSIPYKKTSLPSMGGCLGGQQPQQQQQQQNCKAEAKMNPSTFRQFLPIALCILSFATVLSILLIVYMDPTEIRHQQFRLNMSRDYELISVAQDDPTLIEFLREIHMKKYPMHFLKGSQIEEHLNFTEHHELTPDMARFIAELLGNKKNGNFIQSMTGSTRSHLTGPWLAETLNWTGTIVEPEPRQYFSLRRQHAHRSIEVVHACISPNRHPKEVTIYNEDDSEVKINSLMNDEMSWFSSRVKCFPLYTLMLAVNQINYDLLSLGVQGHELEILQTLPFDRVNIEVISIHLPDQLDSIIILEPNSIHSSKFDSSSSLITLTSSISSSFSKTSDKLQTERKYKTIKEYIQSITKFLMGKSYKLQKKFEHNYVYAKTSSRNRKRYSQSRHFNK